MSNDTDEKFYARSDAHIHLSNEQLADAARGKVSASMMFATSRFNAWVSAQGFQSGEDMASKRDEAVAYFTNQFKLMLEENMDNYIANFDSYMGFQKKSEDA